MIEPVLEVQALTVRAGARCLVERLSFALAPGEFLALLGCNGSGKSLSLRSFAGLRAPAAGTVRLAGAPLAGRSRRAIAEHMALLLQEQEECLPFTALESVLIGRHARLRWWERERSEDLRIAHESLAALEIEALAERPLNSLSGGEQQRVAIAAVLAQQPRVFLLDEPGNHLDPRQQLIVLALMRARCDAGAACIASLHDPGLADRFADRVLLLHGDGRWQLGRCAELLDEAVLGELYGLPMRRLEGAGRRAFIPA